MFELGLETRPGIGLLHGWEGIRWAIIARIPWCATNGWEGGLELSLLILVFTDGNPLICHFASDLHVGRIALSCP